jgi:uncharacterized surface protein with fasciclin (FAS1) repeats
MDGMKKLTIVFLVLTLLAVATAGAQVVSQNNIANTMSGYQDLSTLIKAINAAGIGNVLNDKGPYTLFAPTDTAFSQFTPNTLSLLMQDKQKLGDVLMYHIVPGKVTISDLASARALKTIDGRTLPVTVHDGYVDVGGARVINKGVECTNGIIYPVDGVIIPPVSAQGAPILMPQQAKQPAAYQPPPPPASTPFVQPPPAKRGIGALGILLLVLGALILGGLLLLWLFMRFVRRLFGGRPRPGYQQPSQPGYTRPAPGDIKEPAQFGTGGTMRDEGPYIATGPATTAAVSNAITFDESAIEQLSRMDKSSLAGIKQYIIGSYNNFRDRLDLVKDAHIDLQEIRDNNAVKRLMDRYRLSQFNSNTLELALERNATIYTIDPILMRIYQAAGARVEDLRKLIAGA